MKYLISRIFSYIANGKYSYADGEAPKEKEPFSPSQNSSSEQSGIVY